MYFTTFFDASSLCVSVCLCVRPDRASADLSMIWTFPYFFEPRILECLPSLVMLDYQVTHRSRHSNIKPTCPTRAASGSGGRAGRLVPGRSLVRIPGSS